MGRTETLVLSRDKPARQHEAEQAPLRRSANCKKKQYKRSEACVSSTTSGDDFFICVGLGISVRWLRKFSLNSQYYLDEKNLRAYTLTSRVHSPLRQGISELVRRRQVPEIVFLFTSGNWVSIEAKSLLNN